MNSGQYQKVTARHLARDAYLYVRHATPRQGFENDEVIQRHYNLRQQAVVLGWPVEKVIVVESDSGQSGASQAHRAGFQQLVRQIELGCVGIIMTLEPSRLARNVSDWHRLMDACALSDTLLLDQDGLYDPADSNDRVLLGCDKTMPRTAEFCQFGKETRV
jgi:DNA invertase Pin-like site-specific DNA recombinase